VAFVFSVIVACIHEFFPGSFLAHWLAPEADIRRLLEQNEIAADTLQ
jgi:hypothetical protein